MMAYMTSSVTLQMYTLLHIALYCSVYLRLECKNNIQNEDAIRHFHITFESISTYYPIILLLICNIKSGVIAAKGLYLSDDLSID